MVNPVIDKAPENEGPYGGTKAFGASGADNSTSSRAEEGTRANACVGKREGT